MSATATHGSRAASPTRGGRGPRALTSPRSARLYCTKVGCAVEVDGLRLLRRAGRAGGAAEVLQLVDVLGIAVLLVSAYGSSGRYADRSYVNGVTYGSFVSTGGVARSARRPRAGRLLHVRDDVVVAVAVRQASMPAAAAAPTASPAVLRRSVRDPRHERVVGGLHIRCLARDACDEHVARRLGDCRVDRGPGGALTPVANGSRPPSTAATAS